jgi:hypothetical protein
MGERPPRAELGPNVLACVRRLRPCGGHPLCVGAAVGDLERAEPAAVAPAGKRHDVRPEAPEPRVRADPRCDPVCPGGRRDVRAARRLRGCLSRLVDQGAGLPRSAPRRVRAPSLSRPAPGGDAVGAGLPQLHDHCHGRSRAVGEPRAQAPRAEADLAHRVRVPDEPAGHLPRRLARRSRPSTWRAPPGASRSPRSSTC